MVALECAPGGCPGHPGNRPQRVLPVSPWREANGSAAERITPQQPALPVQLELIHHPAERMMLPVLDLDPAIEPAGAIAALTVSRSPVGSITICAGSFAPACRRCASSTTSRKQSLRTGHLASSALTTFMSMRTRSARHWRSGRSGLRPSSTRSLPSAAKSSSCAGGGDDGPGRSWHVAACALARLGRCPVALRWRRAVRLPTAPC
jgi:hypothetical protein